MDIDREIARLVSELGELSHDAKPIADYDNLTSLNVRLLGYILFTQTPPTMREISDSMGITLPSTSVMVDRLEKDKLLSRYHDKNDRRIVRVEISAEGRKLMQAYIERSTKPLKDALLSLSEADKNIVLKFFQAYTESIRNQSSES